MRLERRSCVAAEPLVDLALVSVRRPQQHRAYRGGLLVGRLNGEQLSALCFSAVDRDAQLVVRESRSPRGALDAERLAVAPRCQLVGLRARIDSRPTVK